jgi:hypothetical protein
MARIGEAATPGPPWGPPPLGATPASPLGMTAIAFRVTRSDFSKTP